MPFNSTRWTLVSLASSPISDAAALEALEQLCKSYYAPLYAYVRSRGLKAQDAEDMTQAFFLQLLDKRVLQQARRERGKFRNFLIASMKHFMSHDWHRQHAVKRGGFQTAVSLDENNAGDILRSDPASGPDRVFEREWARTTLEAALARLDAENSSDTRQARYGPVREFVAVDPVRIPYGRIATETGQTEGALRVAVHRYRKRYGEIIREQIQETLGPDDDLDEEIRYLLSVLSSG